MLDACATRATAAGIARIGLEVRADNVAAIRLYGRAGFVVEGRHRGAMRIDDTDHDTLSMALRTAWEHSA
jgi:ribosomal protein S18 acetylase RimI-like enzyme